MKIIFFIFFILANIEFSDNAFTIIKSLAEDLITNNSILASNQYIYIT